MENDGGMLKDKEGMNAMTQRRNKKPGAEAGLKIMCIDFNDFVYILS